MTNRTMLLKCAVAALAMTAGLQPATAGDADPAAYVRACDAYGQGFFYIPGTETCLKIGGYLRHEIAAGDNVYYGGSLDGPKGKTRASLRFDARSGGQGMGSGEGSQRDQPHSAPQSRGLADEGALDLPDPVYRPLNASGHVDLMA